VEVPELGVFLLRPMTGLRAIGKVRGEFHSRLPKLSD
jgi:hypothetical protein